MSIIPSVACKVAGGHLNTNLDHCRDILKLIRYCKWEVSDFVENAVQLFILFPTKEC